MTPPPSSLAFPPDARTPDKARFKADTADAFASVRRAMAAMVLALPSEIRRAADLQKALQVDYKLSWQVFNIIHATDPLAAANHVPGKPSLRRLLAAAETCGVPASTIADVQSAVERFNTVVSSLAGDRSAFDSMVSSLAPGDAGAAVDLQHRRSAYRSESHIWGRQLDAHVGCVFVKRAADGKGTDESFVALRQGLRRLRPEVPFNVYGYRHANPSATVPGELNLEPYEPDVAKQYDAPLIPQFSTQPLPQMKTTHHANGWARVFLVGDEIGRDSDVNFAFGGIARNAPFLLDAQGQRIYRFSSIMNTPAALVVTDLYLHKPSFGDLAPRLMIFRAAYDEHVPVTVTDTQHLPIREKITPIGSAANPVAFPELPRYPEVVQYACEKAGWDPNEFTGYRIRVAFPVLYSCVRMHLELGPPSA